MAKIPHAIIGSGNIGSDLMTKSMRMSEHLELGAMVGTDPASDALARAALLGVATTHEGIEGRRKLPNYTSTRVVFDAASAAGMCATANSFRPTARIPDLTPVAIGPFTIPVINGEANFDEPNVKMIACGGQSTIPICTPDRVPRPADFEEIKATIPSQMTRLVARLSSAGTRMLIA